MKILLAIVAFACSIYIPNSASAMVNFDNIENGTSMFDVKDNFSNTLQDTTQTMNDSTAVWSAIIPALFTILFIYFLIRLAYGLVTKVGSTLKAATWGIISIPVIFIFLRVTGIFILGERNLIKADSHLESIVSLLSSTVYYVAIALVLIGLLFRFGYKLINHPAYGRWSNRLFLFSVLSIILSSVIKPVLYNI